MSWIGLWCRIPPADCHGERMCTELSIISFMAFFNRNVWLCCNPDGDSGIY